jgi:hypothetical protein
VIAAAQPPRKGKPPRPESSGPRPPRDRGAAPPSVGHGARGETPRREVGKEVGKEA